MIKYVVYDIETLFSCFTYTDINIDTEEINQFVLHKDRFEFNELIKHLKTLNAQIGFNNNSFDYPIIHFILDNEQRLSLLNSEEIIETIYNRAQNIIINQNSIFGTSIKNKDIKIKQLDLFKLWHYNNKARSTSLKVLEISMNYPNVMEMPIHYSKKDITLLEVEDILKYNLNDVLATLEFYKRSKEKIDLRKDIKNKYNIQCLNSSDSKIGESLILKLYCNKTGLDSYKVKELRTSRSEINLQDCILPYIDFKTQKFQKLLLKLQLKTITETKGSIKESVIFNGFKYDYGTGGIHGCIKPGIYINSSDYLIIDADVSSLYPSLSITNNFYPEHLGEDFVEVYKDIIDQRMNAKRAGEMAISDALKLSANSVYGKSNDENSFLYDPKFTMQITVNGQLLLSMLAEELNLKCGDIQMLQINTDGLTVKIHKSQLDKYYQICKEWEIQTKLNLEFVEYSKMIIGDVNNYIAINTKGKIKYKGRYEINKMVGNEHAYHKDNSFKIIPIALSEYFINKIPIEDTIKNHTNIYDFSGRQKFSKESEGEMHQLKYDSTNNPYNHITKQQKNTRYYLSTNGNIFVKRYSKGTTELINKGYKVTIFNNYIEKEFKDYKIDYSFYIKEAYKEINLIETKQLNLF